MHFQSQYYSAEYWYNELEKFTPKSKLIHLSDEDINLIMNIDNRTFTISTCNEIQSGLDNGLHFIKSTKKSSHMRRPVNTLQECINEIGDYADVIMSFKNGCRWLFMREYIENISEEYRIIIYEGKITYIEQYVVNYDDIYMNTSNAKIMKTKLLNFVINHILPIIHYKDATLDIARTKDDLFRIIEVNTPPYLFAGLGLCDIDTEPDLVYTHKDIEHIPFMYISIYNNISEV